MSLNPPLLFTAYYKTVKLFEFYLPSREASMSDSKEVHRKLSHLSVQNTDEFHVETPQGVLSCLGSRENGDQTTRMPGELRVRVLNSQGSKKKLIQGYGLVYKTIKLQYRLSADLD